jgi:hypothetical protein
MGLILTNMTGLSLTPNNKGVIIDTNDSKDGKNSKLLVIKKPVKRKQNKVNNNDGSTAAESSHFNSKKKIKLSHEKEKSQETEKNYPKCNIEVRKWSQGSYTLITDDNREINTKALDLMVRMKDF